MRRTKTQQAQTSPLDEFSLAALYPTVEALLQKPQQRLATGWPILDAALSDGSGKGQRGFPAPGYVALAAPPKAGKSTWSQMIAEQHVERGGWAVCVDLENGRERFYRRLLYRRGRFSNAMLANNGFKRLNTAEKRRYRNVEAWFKTGPGKRLALRDKKVSAPTLCAFVRKCAAHEKGRGLVVVDSLQKIATVSKERRNEVDNWLRVFENLCQETKTTILTISEMPRPPQGKPYRGGLSAFKESGDVEYTADLALTMTAIPNVPDTVVLTIEASRDEATRDTAKNKKTKKDLTATAKFTNTRVGNYKEQTAKRQREQVS
jgi:KaiC/GvpD/RAD55 family RecA-like ATPase